MFSSVLTNVGNGSALEPEDVLLIESRFVTADRAMAEAPGALRLYYSNGNAGTFNTEVALRGIGDVIAANACDR